MWRLPLARNRKQRMHVAYRHLQAFTTNLLITDINLEFTEVCKVVEVKLYYLLYERKCGAFVEHDNNL